MRSSLHAPPGWVTTLAAVLCGALGLLALLVSPHIADASVVLPAPGGAAWWVTVAGIVLQSIAVSRVDARPHAALIATAVPIPVVALAGAGDATSITALAVVATLWFAARSAPLRTLATPFAVVAAAMVAGGAIAARDGDWLAAIGGSLLQAVGTLGPVLFAATWSRALRETRQARDAQGQAVARVQDALVQAAIARERTDMARELHDIAAHHLSGIAVLAAAVERQIDTDPEGAKHAVHQVREQSTSVLRDLRSLVGLLREHDPAPDARPETIAGIRDLVADVAATGRDVDLTVLGDDPVPGWDVGPLAQFAAYRAAQEALTNATRHAPGASCRVTIDSRDDEAVVVIVHNDPPVQPPPETSDGGGGGGGFGLLGMRERAQLTNAELEVGPTADGGWQVSMRLPREETP